MVTQAKRKIFKVGEIVPADYNPRKITDKQRSGLKKSLEKFGYLQDVIVNIRSGKNIIVGGHRRLEELGLVKTDEIECTIVDLNERDEKALNIALNNKHISGEYDEIKLDEILAELTDYDDFNDLNLDDLVGELGDGKSGKIEFDEIGFADEKTGKTTINITCLQKDKENIINELKQIGKDYDGFGIYF
jgi:hypothetical protein